jgi:hypothetical protein
MLFKGKNIYLNGLETQLWEEFMDLGNSEHLRGRDVYAKGYEKCIQKFRRNASKEEPSWEI